VWNLAIAIAIGPIAKAIAIEARCIQHKWARMRCAKGQSAVGRCGQARVLRVACGCLVFEAPRALWRRRRRTNKKYVFNIRRGACAPRTAHLEIPHTAHSEISGKKSAVLCTQECHIPLFIKHLPPPHYMCGVIAAYCFPAIHTPLLVRTRTRTKTNPYDTKAIAVGRSGCHELIKWRHFVALWLFEHRMRAHF
jgi:hypothetical protein